MRVSSAPCDAGKKTVMEEMFVNFAALENPMKLGSSSGFVMYLPDLILPDFSSLRYIELLCRSPVRDIVKVDVVFVRKLRPCVSFYPCMISRFANQRNLCRRPVARTCFEQKRAKLDRSGEGDPQNPPSIVSSDPAGKPHLTHTTDRQHRIRGTGILFQRDMDVWNDG